MLAAAARGSWGLVLSGGGVLGAAHLGVLRALEGWGLRPDVEVGTSAGGLVAGGRAAGLATERLAAFFGGVCREPWRFALAEAGAFARGLFSGTLLGVATLRPMLARLAARAPRPEVRQWPATAAVMTVDIGWPGGLVAVRGGGGVWSTVDALQATSAIPGLFQAVRRGDHLYVDGGLQDDLPVAAAFDMGARRVVAVNVGGGLPMPPLPPQVSLAEVVARAVSYGTAALERAGNRARGPVLTLRPEIPAGAGLLSFRDYDRLVQSGYAAARKRQEEILRFVGG